MPTPAEQLHQRLRNLNHPPTWQQAARLGIELVDPDGTANPDLLHLADGAIVYRYEDGWSITEHARTGLTIRTGTIARVHNPGIDPDTRIHPTATIDPTARIEAGAQIGPHTHIGTHAHIGRDTIIFRTSWIGDGAYIGTGSKLRAATIIGPGTIIGSGSDIGTCSRLAAGTTIEQGATLEPFTTSTANTRLRPRPHRTGQVAHVVERLAGMNRAD